MRREMAKATTSIEKFQTGISRSMKIVGVALAGIAVGGGLKSAIGDAMKFEAAMGQVNRLMGSSAQEFANWANAQSSAFGMSRSEAVRYGAVYANLLSGFSSGTADTMQRTQDLLKASAVVASSTGRTMEDTMERIRSGMLGNTEAVEDLGINVGISMIQSTKSFQKFANGKSWQKLDFQTQQTIRYFAILEQAATKYGLELAQNTTSRQSAFTAQLKNAQLSLGQAFLPIYNAVLPALTRMAEALSNVMAVVAQFSQALFGGSAAKAQAKTTTAQTGAVDDLGDAYEEAGKKAKNSVAGFDEVNTLGSGSGSDPKAPSAGGTFVDTGAGAEAEGISQKIMTMADNVKKFVGSINLQPISESFERLKTALAPFTETFFAGLRWFWDNVLVPFGTWAIESLIPAFMDLLSGALTILNPILEAFKPLALFLWDNFLQPIAAWTGGVIVATLESLGTALTNIGNWMSEHQTIVTNTTLALTGFFAAWKVVELMAFIQMSGSVSTAFALMTAKIWANTGAVIVNAAETMYLKLLYAQDLVVAIGSAIAALGRKTAAWIASTAAIVANKVALLANKVLLAGEFLVAMGSAAIALATNAASWIASTAAMVANKVAMVASRTAQIAMTVATVAWNVAAGIGTVVTTAFGIAIGILTSPITLVIAAIALLVTGIVLLVKNWDTVSEAASRVWEDIKRIWSVAYDWLNTNVIKPIANLYIGLFNGIIDGVNWVIRALNKINFSFPDWIPGLGGKSFGINISEISHIPKLARGGIVDGPTNFGNFIAGEAGAEMIVPLENTSFTDKIASALGSAVLNAMQMGQGQGQGKGETIIQIDGVTFARAIQRYSAGENKRIGSSIITTT